MRTKTKKLICGLLGAGALLTIVGTANAEFCRAEGKINDSLPTYDLNTTNQNAQSLTYFFMDTNENGTAAHYWGYTTKDKLANILIASLTHGRNVKITSDDCNAPDLAGGRLYQPMGLVDYVELKEVEKLQPAVSKKPNLGNQTLQK